jgi:hypothetical protein
MIFRLHSFLKDKENIRLIKDKSDQGLPFLAVAIITLKEVSDKPRCKSS